MARSAKLAVNLMTFSLAVFFLVLGVLEVIPNLDESYFTLKSGMTLEIIFGILELFSGLILLLSMFTFIDKKVLKVAVYLILILWIARIVLTKIATGVPTHYPALLNWLLLLFTELIIAAGILIVVKKVEE